MRASTGQLPPDRPPGRAESAAEARADLQSRDHELSSGRSKCIKHHSGQHFGIGSEAHAGWRKTLAVENCCRLMLRVYGVTQKQCPCPFRCPPNCAPFSSVSSPAPKSDV